MTYLLDTNIVSELRRETPNGGIWEWASSVVEETVFISVVMIAEIRSGVDRLPLGKRRQDLEIWLQQDIRERFRGRILGVDVEAAEICGQLLGQNHLGIHVRRIMDIWLAAIALRHNLTVVTRNTRDFEHLGLALFNPWTEEPPP